MKEELSYVVFWFRRDLRLNDNKGLYHALKSGKKVLALFIFDDCILDHLPADDHRVYFIYQVLNAMQNTLKKNGKVFMLKRGKPRKVFRQLLKQYNIGAVYCNADHEPYGIERDKQVRQILMDNGVGFEQYLDHLVMGKGDVLKKDQSPYHVYSPYSRRWKEHLTDEKVKHYASEEKLSQLADFRDVTFPALEKMGLKEATLHAPPLQIDEGLIRDYHKYRDYPAKEGTSRLGVHLRFGTVSIRALVRKAVAWNDTFLNELIWREFYAMLLYHYPKVVDQAFKSGYDRIEWRNDEREFRLWQNGLTGYPMVDAGMRQLTQTGYMHNRLRMVTASFLSKHLLIDWRWGEAWFAEKLFDYELSSNNGGWQWSAGTGCDAAPYFRIFNPATQQKKFDPDAAFICQWIPELDSTDYPKPMVDHSLARERCLKAYRKALDKQ